MMMTNSYGGYGKSLTTSVATASATEERGSAREFGQRLEGSGTNGSSAVRVRCHTAAQINLPKTSFPAHRVTGGGLFCGWVDYSSISNNNKGS